MNSVKTNMAGNVWKINVAAGDKVEEGQDVVVLESMKMEIPIECEFSGTVKEIKVEEGDFVNNDDVLLTVE